MMRLRKTKIPKNKRNEKYWKARNKTEERYIKKRLSDDEAFNKVLQQHFDKAQDEIQKEIDLQLYKLSTKNAIDITKVRGVVDNADISVNPSNFSRLCKTNFILQPMVTPLPK